MLRNNYCFICEVNRGYFCFPLSNERLQRWMTSLGLKQKPPAWARICVQHFCEWYFRVVMEKDVLMIMLLQLDISKLLFLITTTIIPWIPPQKGYNILGNFFSSFACHFCFFLTVSYLVKNTRIHWGIGIFSLTKVNWLFIWTFSIHLNNNKKTYINNSFDIKGLIGYSK